MELIFNSLSIKRFIYLVLTACVTFTAYYHSHNSQSYWLAWSGLMFALITVGDTRRHRIIIILFTGFAAMSFTFVAGYLATYMPLLAIYLFLVTACTTFAGLSYPNYFYLFFLINLFAILGGSIAPSMLENGERMVCIGEGVFIATVLQIVFLLKFMRNALQAWLIIALRNLQFLSKEFFSCFLQSEYIDNVYLFERRIHNQKNRFMQALGRLREMVSQVTGSKHADMFAPMLLKLDCLYDILLDGGQLRQRVTDHTIFQVCNEELTAVSQEMEKLLGDVISVLAFKNQHVDLANLDVKIARFEDNYQHVMQITAREPLPIFLFIATLKAFRNELAALYAEALRVRLFLK